MLDLRREAVSLLAGLRRRMETQDYELTRDDLAVFLTLNELQDWATATATVNTLASVQSYVLCSVMKLLEGRQGAEFYRTNLWKCPCGHEPILVIVQNAATRLADQKCPKCKRVERLTLTERELEDLRLRGIPLDDLGRAKLRKSKRPVMV